MCYLAIWRGDVFFKKSLIGESRIFWKGGGGFACSLSWLPLSSIQSEKGVITLKWSKMTFPAKTSDQSWGDATLPPPPQTKKIRQGWQTSMRTFPCRAPPSVNAYLLWRRDTYMSHVYYIFHRRYNDSPDVNAFRLRIISVYCAITLFLVTLRPSDISQTVRIVLFLNHKWWLVIYLMQMFANIWVLMTEVRAYPGCVFSALDLDTENKCSFCNMIFRENYHGSKRSYI